MRVYHWVAIIAAGALLTASAAAVVIGTQTSTKSDDVRTTAAKNDRSGPVIRESQVRQTPPAGAPAASAPARVESIAYDSWVVVCQDAVGGTVKKTCSATLRAMTPDQRQLVLTWQIGSDKDGHFVTGFRVPPSVAIKKDDKVLGGPLLVQNGLELKFGNGPARRVLRFRPLPVTTG